MSSFQAGLGDIGLERQAAEGSDFAVETDPQVIVSEFGDGDPSELGEFADSEFGELSPGHDQEGSPVEERDFGGGYSDGFCLQYRDVQAGFFPKLAVGAGSVIEISVFSFKAAAGDGPFAVALADEPFPQKDFEGFLFFVVSEKQHACAVIVFNV